jgi:hypothetical protein
MVEKPQSFYDKDKLSKYLPSRGFYKLQNVNRGGGGVALGVVSPERVAVGW